MSKVVKLLSWFFVFLVVIIVLTTIPNILWITKRANEASALQSMRSIFQAELWYSEAYPNRGFTCSLHDLSDPALGSHALSPNLASGMKYGYIFSISDCHNADLGAANRSSGFKALAVPQVKGRTGTRSFCFDEKGKVTFDPLGGDQCTQPVN